MNHFNKIWITIKNPEFGRHLDLFQLVSVNLHLLAWFYKFKKINVFKKILRGHNSMC